MTSPSVPEERPWRSEAARSLRWNPIAAIARATRAAVGSATPASPLITRETGLRLTPATCGTSRIVGVGFARDDPPPPPPPPPARQRGQIPLSNLGPTLVGARGGVKPTRPCRPIRA